MKGNLLKISGMAMEGLFLKMAVIILGSGKMIRSVVRGYLLDSIKKLMKLFMKKGFGIKMEN